MRVSKHRSLLRHNSFTTFGMLCSHLGKWFPLTSCLSQLLLLHTPLLGTSADSAEVLLGSLFNNVSPRGSSDPSACKESCPLHCSIRMFSFLWRILSFLELYIVRLFNVLIKELLFAVKYFLVVFFGFICMVNCLKWHTQKYAEKKLNTFTAYNHWL